MSACVDRRVPPTRGRVERGAAWLVTGPLGHLYAVLADIVVIAARQAAIRARRRLGR